MRTAESRPPDKGRRLRTRGQPRARRGPPVTRGRARRGRTHTGSPSSRMQTRGADAVPGPGGRGSTHRTLPRRLPQGAPARPRPPGAASAAPLEGPGATPRPDEGGRLFQCLGGFAGTSASTCSSLRRFPHLPESSQTFSHHSFTPTFPPALSDHESISCLCRSASSGRFMKNEPCNTWPLASGSSPDVLVPGAIHVRRVRGLVASSG